MKRLIVCADDFGLDPAVNAAVEEAYRHGILSTASLMVGAPAAADAVARAHRLPGLRVGLHLVLVDGRAVLQPDAVPGMVGVDGELDHNMARAGVRFFFLPAIRRQLAQEIRAQFEAFRATELELDHVNAHKHMHLHPDRRAADHRHWPRLWDEGGAGSGRARGCIATRRAARACADADPRPLGRAVAGSPAPRRARGQRPPFGLAWSGKMVEERVLRLLPYLPDGVSEIYFHPAIERTPALVRAMPDYRQTDELAALTSSAAKARITEFGITLTSYSGLHI